MTYSELKGLSTQKAIYALLAEGIRKDDIAEIVGVSMASVVAHSCAASRKKSAKKVLSIRKLKSKYVVGPMGECWNWKGFRSSIGYGVYEGRAAHRLVYESHKGEVPRHLVLHHECRNKACVNPHHLIKLTPRQHGVIHGGGRFAAPR